MANILVVTKWYPNDDDPTHALFVKEFVKAKALYNNVIVFYGELTSIRKPKFPFEVIDRFEDGIRTIRFVYRRRPLKLHRIINIIGWIYCLYKIKKENIKPDIIHFQEYDASLPVFIYAKRKNIPLVITEHFTGFVKNSLSYFARIVAKIILRRATIVLPVSNHLKKYLYSYAPNTKLEVVNNIVDVSLFKAVPVTVKGREEQKEIITVARLVENKGIEYLIKALNVLKNIRTDFFLNIIGDGELKEKLINIMKEFKLEEFIKFYGALPKHKVAEYMSKSDFFVLPSLFETFGCVIIEAMSCGKPVLATNIGGPDEIVTTETGILVEPANPDALKDAIEYMLDNYWKYSSENISKYAIENYSYESIGKKLDRIYREILS
ncbi:MAG: glycosyltransferase [Candidatus Poribacteria bacterium]